MHNLLKKFKTTLLVLIGILIAGVSYCQPSLIEKAKNFPYQIPRLSPVPSNVEGVNSYRISLNGTWDFGINERATGTIQVPGE